MLPVEDVFPDAVERCCNVRITGRVRQTSYEAEGSTRYGVDMIADGIAILAKASGKPADD